MQKKLTGGDEMIVEATDLRKEYHAGKLRLRALNGVDVHIRRGEVVAIMGPSGCGKTTLLNCLSGLDSVTSGQITIAGQSLTGLSDRQLTAFRAREMGFIFQNYNLLPVLSALENVELPLLVNGVRAREARARAWEALEEVGLEDWARHRPAELSGGQSQRVAIARALVTRPAIVWADEPTGALDSQTGQEITHLMLELNRLHTITFVWVTHAPEVARQAGRLLSMQDGRMAAEAEQTPVHGAGAAVQTRISRKSRS
ncbi:MAG TPA: ABC transporter ATP-binding protein [Ktedonobacteraceae bacterium]|nr:ABC transporter ATP-binding protein [Ktedonobacteraceae bacterium]